MVALESAQALSQRGHIVITACLPGSPLEAALNKAALVALPLPRKHKYFAWKALRGLRMEIEKHKPSAVLVQQLNDLWQVVPALRGHSKIRLIGLAHTFVGIDKKDLLHRWLYNRVDGLVALTELHRKNLMQHLPVPPERLLVLPNSIDTVKFNPTRASAAWRERWAGPDTELLVGVVSRLDRNKGLLESVAAAQCWRDWGLKIRMVIIGKETAGQPGAHEMLSAEIRKRSLESEVRLIGHHEDIATAIASLDVLLMPSPAETFGRVLIEAMACGVPVVASAGGGVPDIIRDGENGLLVPPLDSMAMAKAIRRYHDSPELRQRISEQGLRDAKNIYAADAVQSRLRDILGLSSH